MDYSELASPTSHLNVPKNLLTAKDPGILRQERLALQKKKYEETLEQISYLQLHLPPEERKYYYPDDFRPFLFFYKFLAKRPDACSMSTVNRLRLWIPDTIITAEGDNPPMWIYSSPEGYVYRSDSFTAKSIITKLAAYASPEEIVAVLKKVISIYHMG